MNSEMTYFENTTLNKKTDKHMINEISGLSTNEMQNGAHQSFKVKIHYYSCVKKDLKPFKLIRLHFLHKKVL